MSKFVAECASRNLPLNAGKEVIRASHATILGGTLDGDTGALRHAADKGHKLVARTLALLSLKLVPQAALQHWTGSFCFAAGFRKCLFSSLAEVFSFISSYEDVKHGKLVLPAEVSDEILLAAALLPLAGTNLRSPLRLSMSISDASEQGGAAAIATHFCARLDKVTASASSSRLANANEEALAANPPVIYPFCSICTYPIPEGVKGRCVVGCSAHLCSALCYKVHRKTVCTHTPPLGVVVGIVDMATESWWLWAAVGQGLAPVVWDDLKQTGEAPGAFCCTADLPTMRLSRANQVRSSRKPTTAIHREDASQVNFDNRALLKLIRFFNFCLVSGRAFFFLHLAASFLWAQPPMLELLNKRTVKRSSVGLGEY